MKRMSGFSLMEMMVVLLIVAIIAAASAPMISKKSISAASEKSPWVWTKKGSIAYNLSGGEQSAVIGDVSPDINSSRLFIRSDGTKPHLTLGVNDRLFKFLADSDNNIGLGVSDYTIPESLISPTNGIAIGSGAKIVGEKSIAIGNSSEITKALKGSIAIGSGAGGSNVSTISIGYKAKAERDGAIAIGSEFDPAPAGNPENPALAKGPSAIAIGRQSYAGNKDSTAVGRGAYAYTSAYDGAYLTAIGAESKASADCATALGSGAVASAKYAIAIGAKKLEGSENSTEAAGKDSIAIGHEAKAGIEGNIAIGKNAQAIRSSSIIVIGNDSVVSQPNSIAIGRSIKLDKANVIQLGTAGQTVYIPGNLVVDKVAILNTKRSGGGVWIGATDAYGWGYEGGGTGENFRLNENADAASALASIGFSDRRLKNVGKAFVGGLEEIKKLEVFNYTFKKDPAKTPRVGVMAQDLQKIFPSAVFKGDDGFLRIRMEDMFYAMVNAIKDLASKFDVQDKKIAELEKQNKELTKAVADLEKRLAKLEKKK